MKDVIDAEFDVVGAPPPAQIGVSRWFLRAIHVVGLGTFTLLAFGLVAEIATTKAAAIAAGTTVGAWLLWPLSRAISALGERVTAAEAGDLRSRIQRGRRQQASGTAVRVSPPEG